MEPNYITTRAKTYARGVIIGGALGAIFALVTKKRVFLWATISAVAGGFIASEIKKSEEKSMQKKTNFKNYDI